VSILRILVRISAGRRANLEVCRGRMVSAAMAETRGVLGGVGPPGVE